MKTVLPLCARTRRSRKWPRNKPCPCNAPPRLEWHGRGRCFAWGGKRPCRPQWGAQYRALRPRAVLRTACLRKISRKNILDNKCFLIYNKIWDGRRVEGIPKRCRAAAGGMCMGRCGYKAAFTVCVKAAFVVRRKPRFGRSPREGLSLCPESSNPFPSNGGVLRKNWGKGLRWQHLGELGHVPVIQGA